MASSLPVSARSPSAQVLEKLSQSAVAKGGCVCESAHLSPADGGVSGHTVPPARVASRAWPSPQRPSRRLAPQRPADEILLWIKLCNTFSNAGQYPAYPGHFTPSCPQQRHQFDKCAVTMLRLCTLLFCHTVFRWSAHCSVSNGHLVNGDRAVYILMKWTAGLTFCFHGFLQK